MKKRFYLYPTLFAAVFAFRSVAAETPAAEPSMKDELHAQLIQDAAKQTANPTAAPTNSNLPSGIASTSTDKGSDPKKLAAPSPTPKPGSTTSDATVANKNKGDTPTMMPQVEVRKNRITELDRAVHAKDIEIEKETEKTHASETDKALNGTKTSGFLSFLGGRSAAVGEDLARQRVMLLEVERDLVSEIALAKTKEEKADLQKQLDDIKAMRRDLDKAR